MELLGVRNFHAFSGGHVKYLDYLNHLRTLDHLDLRLHLTAGLKRDRTNPFLSRRAPSRRMRWRPVIPVSI
ncbi:MAG TPA: hypothetical protein VED87_10365 [Methylocystis sp.]|nr:hypothetical protein [Methylocystis sp.]